MMKLHALPKLKGANKANRRKGRGLASGKGKTAGVGIKGQKVRTQLGRNRLQRFKRFPFLRGKGSRRIERSIRPQLIKLGSCHILSEDAVITPEVLQTHGLISVTDLPVKILASGTLKKALQFSSEVQFSANARKKLEQAGGKVIAQ